MRVGATLLLISGAVGLTVAAHGCVYPDFQFRPSGAVAGGSAGMGGSGAGAEGGMGATSSSGGTAGSGASAGSGGGTTTTPTGGAGGDGGAGGSIGPPCMPWVVGECGDGNKCSVIDESTGATGCVLAGAQPPWTLCLTNQECADGTWCDHTTGVCKPVCVSGSDCPAGAVCIPAADGQDQPIPGLQLCTSYCDPENVGPCSQAFGPTTCVSRGADGMDCWASGNKGKGDGCAQSQECRGGLVCRSGECREVCHDVGDMCCFLFCWCRSVDPAAHWNGHEYGACELL